MSAVRLASRARSRLTAVFWSLCAVPLCFVAGCSGTTVLVDTAGGVTPIYSPSRGSDALIGPPPGLQPSSTLSTGPIDPSGVYSGTAVPLVTGGGICIENRPVTGFRVSGRSVRYGGYRGTIAPDGGLQMAQGQSWIIGQFEGATFHGQIDQFPGFEGLGCTYMLNLARVGP